MRYGKRKRRKRAARRILETAARRLKRDGIHGPGMAEAGLARRHRTAGRVAVRET